MAVYGRTTYFPVVFSQHNTNFNADQPTIRKEAKRRTSTTDPENQSLQIPIEQSTWKHDNLSILGHGGSRYHLLWSACLRCRTLIGTNVVYVPCCSVRRTICRLCCCACSTWILWLSELGLCHRRKNENKTIKRTQTKQRNPERLPKK